MMDQQADQQAVEEADQQAGDCEALDPQVVSFRALQELPALLTEDLRFRKVFVLALLYFRNDGDEDGVFDLAAVPKPALLAGQLNGWKADRCHLDEVLVVVRFTREIVERYHLQTIEPMKDLYVTCPARYVRLSSEPPPTARRLEPHDEEY